MNEQLKPCPFCGCKMKFDRVLSGWNKITGMHKGNCPLDGNDFITWSSTEDAPIIQKFNTRADGWIEVDGAKNIPTGDWMVATCDKESKVDTHIAKCSPNVIVIGGRFHFDMPKVYAYKEIGELPSPPKAASCGE